MKVPNQKAIARGAKAAMKHAEFSMKKTDGVKRPLLTGGRAARCARAQASQWNRRAAAHAALFWGALGSTGGVPGHTLKLA